MATANEVSCPTSMPRCPICLEPYVNPRKLPNCSHSFCEACIATYVIKSVETNEQNTGISCPLCKTLNHVPKDKAAEWVKTLELNEAISGTDGIRATTNQLDCESCRKYGITTKASKMCFVCFEVLCVPCSLGRHSYKTLQSHKVVDVEAGTEQGLKQDDLKDIQVLKDYTVCRDHDERPFELYCKDDECLCCSKCVALNHRKCSDITDLQDNKLEIDVKAKLETAKDFIKKLIRFANNIKEAKNKSMDDMKGQTENIRKTLLELRTKVNRLLDGLDETAMGQAKAIYKKEKLKGEKETGILNETVDGLVACSSLAEAVLKYGCVSHYFGVIQEVEQKMRHSKTTILDISETLKSVELELQPQSKFQNFRALGPNDTDKVANVIEKHHNLEFEPLQGLNMLKDYRVTKIAEKCIKENYYCNDSPTYRDLVFLPNDSAVLVDSHNKYCCLTDRAYKVKDSYQLDRAGHSCSLSKDGNVAVSVPEESKIYVFTTDEKLKCQLKITTTRKPIAIHCLENTDIAVAWKEPVAFGIISSDETPTEKVYFCKDQEGRQFKTFEYMAVNEIRKHVIQPCLTDKAVYCFDYEGYPKFKYTSANHPYGVALDGDGNVYVCSYSEYAIHTISPTGKPIRIIKENCPTNPRAIAFKNGEKFAVTRASSYDRVITFFRLQKPRPDLTLTCARELENIEYIVR